MRRRHLPTAIPAALATTLAVAGCGLGAGEQSAGTRLLVTDAFGSRVLHDLDKPEGGGSDTVMRLLQRNARVTTRYGGGFVQTIDGRGGGTSSGRPVDWFFYVNGRLSQVGAASVRVRPGDAVWWDRHDWGAGETQAVVGQFPAPFRPAPGGRPPRVRIACAAGAAAACTRVRERLTAGGATVTPAALGARGRAGVLRVLVGPYAALRTDPAARTLERGPQVSGVYARPAADGATIALLDSRGRTAGTLPAGGGLVAATIREDGAPVWLITGTDAAGVTAAAGALRAGLLARRFAAAVLPAAGAPSVVGVPAR